MDKPVFTDLLDKCSGCNICRRVCPPFQAAHRAASSPAGAIAILSDWLKSNPSSNLAAETLNFCTLCGKCEDICPARLPLTRIFSYFKCFLQPKSLKKQLKLKIFQSPYLIWPKSYLSKEHLSKNLPISLKLPFLSKKNKNSKIRGSVLLFPGCIIREQFPYLAKKAARAIEMAGFKSESPFALKCCGFSQQQPISYTISSIRRNLKILARTNFDILVTPCPGCLKAITKLWPHFLGLSEREKEMAQKIASKSMDMAIFLKQYVTLPELQNQEFILHNPCSLSKEDKDAVRSLFQKDLSLESIDQCCGARCQHSEKIITQPEDHEDARQWRSDILKPGQTVPLATQLANSCRTSIVPYKAKYVITSCPGCMRQLNGQFIKYNDKMQSLHYLDIFFLKIKTF